MTMLCGSGRARRIALLAGLAAFLCGCSKGHFDAASAALPEPILPKRVELLSGDGQALNYTPWYIHTFSIAGPPGSGIRGGGPNVMPIQEDGSPSESGGMCCTTLPAEWQPDLKLTVRWLVDKDPKNPTPALWYKAENVRIAPHGRPTYSIWAIFLPGDRVRFMVTDGNHDGGNNPNHRPPDEDPYIVQGVLDDEWNEWYPNGKRRGVAQ